MMSRRRFLASTSAIGVTAVVGGSFLSGWNGRRWRRSSKKHSSVEDGPTIGLQSIMEGLKQPVALSNPIDEYIYVADKFGQLYLYVDSQLRDAAILDISDNIIMNHGEQGLLGLEFHPDFEKNKKFYLRYSSPSREGTPDGYSHTGVLSEFRMTDDYQSVIAGSERSILEIPQPGKIHNAGDIKFGPDGYLYVTLGDGGGDGHDGSGPLNRGPNSHAGDWYLLNVGGNGQDIKDNLLGSVLRINVDEQGEDRAYTVPDENPLTDTSGLEEHYAWGFRNPYSMSFNGDNIYVADVGTRLFGEINLIEKGGNYGWNVKEAKACHNNIPLFRALSAMNINVRTSPLCPSETPEGRELADPVVVLPHPPGVAIIGGSIYKNSTVREMTDKYVFGDLSGKVFVSDPSSDQKPWDIEEVMIQQGESGRSDRTGSSILSIDKGKHGELYVLTASQDGGKVQKIVSD